MKSFISTAYFSPKLYPASPFTSCFVEKKNEAFLVLKRYINNIVLLSYKIGRFQNRMGRATRGKRIG